MKGTEFLSVLAIAAASLFLAGCETLGSVKPNPISLEMNGTFFVSNPDTSNVIIRYEPDADLWQYDDHFEFELSDALYSKKGRKCVISLEINGLGVVQTNCRYPLARYGEGDKEGMVISTFSYEGKKYEISDGWIEFSEYGVNGEKTSGCVSGTFSLEMKDSSVKVTNGSFGRMLLFSYNDRTTQQ